MDEFTLIDVFFKSIAHNRTDVILGIGDDAACLQVPEGHDLLVSSDTLVAEVHFLSVWDPYDIACKAVMVNVSDIAAMGAVPCWLTLALTLPQLDAAWLARFSAGLRDSLARYNIALVGGDTTHGPLSMTLTIHGLVPKGRAIRRSGASPGDIIYVSGALGSAAFAVASLKRHGMDEADHAVVMQALQHPVPRIDLVPYLQSFATSAIDISDGLTADLQHICAASGVGACIDLTQIPIHPLVTYYDGDHALDFALSGGDDYELCFTVSPHHNDAFLMAIAQANRTCYPIGVIEKHSGLYAKTQAGTRTAISAAGYKHF